MKKAEALSFVNEKYNFTLDNRNAHFSKENAGKPVYWFEIPLSKIEAETFQDIYLITECDGDINLLKVPIKYFRKNKSYFKIREDKQCLCLELDVVTYKNQVGSGKIEFKQFVL